MRILLTTDTIGGVWTFTRELSAHLLAAGHTVALVSFGRPPSHAQRHWALQQRQHFGEAFRFVPCDIPLEWMQNNHRVFAQGSDLLTHIARELRPDILHSNQFCWAALPLDTPKLITAHSDVISWAHAVNPSALHATPWLTRYRSLVQQGLNAANAVVAPTSWMRHALRAHFDVPAPFEVIHNGRTLPAPDHPANRALQALTVGRLWDAAKGTAILAQINAPMPIVLIGEEDFESSVATRLPANLQARGTLDEPQLLDLMRRSSIYIATSIYEPFGLAPLEAALCGCAVLARDIPSLREVWGESARYFNNPNQLEHLLRQLSNDAPTLQRLQHAALERASQYSAASMTSHYLRLYDSLAASAQEPATHAA